MAIGWMGVPDADEIQARIDYALKCLEQLAEVDNAGCPKGEIADTLYVLHAYAEYQRAKQNLTVWANSRGDHKKIRENTP